MFEKTRRRRRAIVVLVAGLALVLAACDTQPATNVTYTSADLNGRGNCEPGWRFWWTYEIREAGGGWRNVGPNQWIDCGGGRTDLGNLNPHRVDGLRPNTTHQYRIKATLADGKVIYYDSQGANGTNYDSFRTSSPWWSRAGDGSEPSSDPGLCDDGTDACASSPTRRCKGRGRPLRNVHYSDLAAFWTPDPFDRYPLWGAHTLSSWCWYAVPHPSAGRIYWRDTRSAKWIDSPFGGVSFGADYWYSSACLDGNSWCLTRREIQAIIGINLPGGLPDLADSQWICIATRVSAGGGHGRAIYKSRCSSIAKASAAKAGPAPGEVVTIRDVGTRAARKRVAEACDSSYAIGRATPKCVAAAKAAYLKLTPAERRSLGEIRR